MKTTSWRGRALMSSSVKRQGLLDEAVDLKLPGARVDDRPIEMRDREELVVGCYPGVEVLPDELVLDADRIRVLRRLIEPGNTVSPCGSGKRAP